MKQPIKRQPANVLCAICGAPVATCNVTGLHGMMRDRARLAADQLAAKKSK